MSTPALALTHHQLDELQTPCYVFDSAAVQANLAGLRERLGTGVVVSFKANPLIDLYVRCAHAYADGVELASLGELNAVVGRANAAKFINTPALDKALLGAAIACRATVVLDSEAQAEMAIALAHPGLRQRGLWLRVNAASLLGERNARTTDHFGMDTATALRVATALHDAGIAVTGLHLHAGSNSYASLALPLARAWPGLLEAFEARWPGQLQALNLGGGLPADWRTADLPWAAYRQALQALPGRLKLLHEAGRAVFADAGVFAVRVLATKSIEGRAVAVCDGGIAQAFQLAQTESVVKRSIVPALVRPAGAGAAAGSGPTTLVGSSCNRADLIGELPAGAAPAVGDYLVFGGCGAYTTYSPVGFLNLAQARKYVL